ncbi:uncharacterized protein LOC116558662 [Sapajus apella]|uniref:Uncharacterized protein LOC116558662 n=1 Tax=Sapajus apella TaxID=9515 RepID=A0A6J3IPY9_SAPAP|nr:uncharacterized protein LOC116558662 [Sapajus apella]
MASRGSVTEPEEPRGSSPPPRERGWECRPGRGRGPVPTGTCLAERRYSCFYLYSRGKHFLYPLLSRFPGVLRLTGAGDTAANSVFSTAPAGSTEQRADVMKAHAQPASRVQSHVSRTQPRGGAAGLAGAGALSCEKLRADELREKGARSIWCCVLYFNAKLELPKFLLPSLFVKNPGSVFDSKIHFSGERLICSFMLVDQELADLRYGLS